MKKNEETTQEDIMKAVKELMSAYSHWFVFYHGTEEHPRVVHMTSFKSEPNELDFQKVRESLKNDPNFKLPPEVINSLRCSQIPASQAQNIIIDNIKDLAYSQQAL